MKTLLHACKVVLGVDAPESQVTQRELSCLLRYSREAEVIVEIGCYEGSTTAYLAANTTGRVYSIDPFGSGRLGVCYGELIAKFIRWKNRLTNIEFIKAFSHVAAPDFQRPVDFIFIDADHSYEAIAKDWQDWFPKVKQGGIIALHDTQIAENSPSYLGSMKFYDQDIPGMPGVTKIDSVDSLSVLRVEKSQ
jgi:predicted O-methyltransferase YrrM